MRMFEKQFVKYTLRVFERNFDGRSFSNPRIMDNNERLILSNFLQKPNLLRRKNSNSEESTSHETIEDISVGVCAPPTGGYHRERRRHSDNLILTNRSKKHLNNLYNNSLNQTNSCLLDARRKKDKGVPFNLNNHQDRRGQHNNLTSNAISETIGPITTDVTTNRRRRNRRQSDGCLVLPCLQPPVKLGVGRRALTPMPLTKYQSMKALNEIECEMKPARKCNSICNGALISNFDTLKTKEIGTTEKIEKFLRSLDG
jgi:hypothetical protein